ncbi:hypothetical protein GSI_11979 [Ganoderma sinense ZZ0214-1]|uniref:Uncharacterized protein n=1 Tax=Ganoderma sinense ZZ0214-1 TaxID=1077348 RepID=A0A2G8RXK3_9APHY|nr:hypothetical protein GSI_11979 [Ganoderma sinense ZZ0214-1]
MSVNIVLPNLPNWVQQRINTLYGAKTAEEFDDAFDAFIAQEVTIKVNGKPISRDAYKKMIRGEITGDVGAQVTFNGVVSVPSEDKDLRAIGTGTVGAFFDAEVFGRIVIFGQNQSSTVSSSMNVVVIQDPTLHHHQVGRGGAFDARRVTNLNEVFTDQQNKIVPPFLPPPSTTTTTTTPASSS